MELPVMSSLGESSNQSELSEKVFSAPYREALVHQVLVAYQAGGRAGTKAQKSRSDVSGGGAKPWRQKGTGRARAGTTRGPLWRTGGVTFAARPRDFSEKINKKAYRVAMRSIISELIREGRVTVIENFNLENPRTRDALALFKAYSCDSGLLIVDTISESLHLATRNLRYFSVLSASQINPVVLVNQKKVLITLEALKKIEALLS